MTDQGIQGEPGERGPQGERGKSGWIAWAITAAIIGLLALSVVGTYNEARHAEEFANELRKSQVQACDGDNDLRSNQRFILAGQRSLYTYVYVRSDDPGFRRELKRQIDSIADRIGLVADQDCESVVPRNGQ